MTKLYAGKTELFSFSGRESVFWSLAGQLSMCPGFQRQLLQVWPRQWVPGQAQASRQKQNALEAPARLDSRLAKAGDESSLEEMNNSILQEVLGFLRPGNSLGIVPDLSHQMTVPACPPRADFVSQWESRRGLAGWVWLQMWLSTVHAASLPPTLQRQKSLLKIHIPALFQDDPNRLEKQVQEGSF